MTRKGWSRVNRSGRRATSATIWRDQATLLTCLDHSDSLLTGSLLAATLALHSILSSKVEFLKHSSHFFPAQSPMILHLDHAANTIRMSFPWALPVLPRAPALEGPSREWNILPDLHTGTLFSWFRFQLKRATSEALSALAQFCVPRYLEVPSWSPTKELSPRRVASLFVLPPRYPQQRTVPGT